jgi:hypothetical protein
LATYKKEQIYRQISSRLGEANTLEGLGDLSTVENDHKQALIYYQQSANTNRQISNIYGEGYNYSDIGRILAKLG